MLLLGDDRSSPNNHHVVVGDTTAPASMGHGLLLHNLHTGDTHNVGV